MIDIQLYILSGLNIFYFFILYFLYNIFTKKYLKILFVFFKLIYIEKENCYIQYRDSTPYISLFFPAFLFSPDFKSILFVSFRNKVKL